ncbi:phage tail family protein [Bacillus carboniphilus]|uniref:Phage tail family protein n=1 Tax=Bacillus carboniphilus TaxID=86663 RepID=A0ABY9JS80_9BACI|nr:distal tail protein Dit [Bacillus carboniphilus]WLR41669.1 phage tail family protein [Bacillus carboniphilus]
MLTFNGKDLSELIRVTEINGRGPLSQTTIRQSIPGKDGSFFQRRQLTERVLSVSFLMIADSLNDLRKKVDQLNGVLNTDFEVPIVFSDEPNMTYYGILEGNSDLEEIASVGKGTLTFVCTDPFKYGIEKRVSFTQSVNQTGLGSYQTPLRLVATITEPVKEYKVFHQEQDKYVKIKWDFQKEDILEVHFHNGKILINDQLAMTSFDWASSEFFDLLPGKQTITVTDGTTTELIWRPRWI